MVRMTCYEAEFDGELQPSSEIQTIDFFVYEGSARCSDVDRLIFEDLHARGRII